MRDSQAFDQVFVSVSFLDWVQFLPLNVLDKREFEQFLLGNLAYDRREARKAGQTRRPPAPFAGNELVKAALPSQQQRLNYSV